jgi:YHS domain-containing protein
MAPCSYAMSPTRSSCAPFASTIRNSRSIEYGGEEHRFCSEPCAEAFERNPERYVR